MMRSFLLLILLLTATPALAAGIDYSRVTDRTESEVVVKRTTLTSETWHRCSVSTLACSDTAANSTISVSEPTPAFMSAYRALMPSGASSLTRSPDGRYIAFYIPATISRGARTWGVMDTTSLAIYTKEEKIAYWDLLTEGIRYYSFSPDSKSLIYIDDVKNQPTLYKVDLAALSGTTLTSAKMFSREYAVAEVIFKDNDTILFIANRDNPYAWALYQYSLSTYALTKLADNVSYDANLRLLGNKLLFGEADSRGVRPALYNFSTKTIERFALPAEAVVETSAKRVTTLLNGLSGTYLLETNKNSDTLIVWLHGGPFRQVSTGYHPYYSYGTYDWVLEVARRANVGVLKIDYPGSAGYGRTFAESVTRKVGVKDATETAEAVADFARRNGYKNVYLMGNSYGGYLALKMLVDKPTAYKGALSVAGVADWTTMLTALDKSIFNVHFGGTVGDENANYDLYTKASVYNKLDALTTQKIVLVHGTADLTIPYKQSEGLASYLAQLGKNYSFITLAEEGHVPKKQESFELLCSTLLTFINRASSAGSCEL